MSGWQLEILMRVALGEKLRDVGRRWVVGLGDHLVGRKTVSALLGDGMIEAVDGEYKLTAKGTAKVEDLEAKVWVASVSAAFPDQADYEHEETRG